MSDQRIEYQFDTPGAKRFSVTLHLPDYPSGQFKDVHWDHLHDFLKVLVVKGRLEHVRGPIEVPPSREDGKCEWSYDEFHGKFDTKCGQGFCFEFNGVRENKFRFCPYCGSEIITRIEAR